MRLDSDLAPSFLMRNSRGAKDGIFTLLVMSFVAFAVLIVGFLVANALFIRSPDISLEVVKSFNDSLTSLITGVFVQIVALATAYLGRRALYDKHYETRELNKLSLGINPKSDNALPGKVDYVFEADEGDV